MMFRSPAFLRQLALTVCLAGAPLLALGLAPRLSAVLTGDILGAEVPTGSASIDQARLPAEPGTLRVEVTRVGLPDGTILTVRITDCGQGPVGTITLRSGQGTLDARLPTCLVGRLSAILVNDGLTTILSGGAPWQF